MTFTERNNLIDTSYARFKVLHDKYTSNTKILTDDQWSEYIHAMDDIARESKGTNLEEIIWGLCQALLDDTETVQKKLKEGNK